MGFGYRVAIATVAMAATLSLSACMPEDVNGSVTCQSGEGGKITCSYTPTTPTDNPDPTDPQKPSDPNAGLPAGTLSATVGQGSVKVDWTTQRTDITGWTVGRDGADTSGSGAWSTDAAASTRSQTFNLLKADTEYTFTLTGKTAAGSLAPVTVKAKTPAAVTPPTNPNPPTSPTGTTAAEKRGWGTPLPASDEFNYTGKPDTAKWDQAGECWAGHDNNGRRCASKSTVQDGFMRQTGTASGDTGWLASKFNQQYGKWEARVRNNGVGANNGRQYHPLLIIWPQSDRWPGDGEYDFYENMAPGLNKVGAFIHYPHPNMPVQQEYAEKQGVNNGEWFNIAVEWTPHGIKGFVNGEQFYSFSNGAGPGGRKNIQDMPSGHLTIQLDNFHGSGMQPATYDVDWVRIYR